MNNRYLFRAKLIDNGEWVEGDLVHSVYKINDTCVGKYGSYVGIHQVDKSTICQCTGLKDKSGKLIWENDVVEIEEHQDNVNGLYKVIYCENSHCYALKRSVDFHYNFFTFSDLNGFETSSKVIGNIFDNPELINE